MSTRVNSCARWRSLIALAAAGVAEAAELRQLESHLQGCPTCRMRWCGAQRLAASLRQVNLATADAVPSPNLRLRWQGALRDAAPVRSSSTPWWGGWGTVWAWLPGGRGAWCCAIGCWMAIAALWITGPKVAGPGSSPPALPLAKMLSLIRTGPVIPATSDALQNVPWTKPVPNRLPSGAASAPGRKDNLA